MAGRYAEALTSHEENIARGGPVGPPALCWAAGSYKALGQDDKVRQVVTEFDVRFPDFGLRDWNFLALIESRSQRDEIEGLFRAAGVHD